MSELPRYEDIEAMRELWKKASYWGPPDEERYTEIDPEDAIEQMLDGIYPDKLTSERMEIVGMSPMSVVGQVDPARILEDVLERLDENYGDLENDPTEPSDEMKAAAKAFAEEIEKAYTPYQCKETARFTFDPLAWAKEHRPDWLESEESAP